MPDQPPPAPDAKRAFLLLRRLGLDDDEAYTLLQEIGNMAAANLIARFESKLDTQNALLDTRNALFESKLDTQNALFESKLDTQNALFESKLDTQNAKLDALRWMFGAVMGLLAALLALGLLDRFAPAAAPQANPQPVIVVPAQPAPPAAPAAAVD